jgi:hypothetical protein
MKKISLMPIMLVINPPDESDMYCDMNNRIITVGGRR